jgi:hypothetical protein
VSNCHPFWNDLYHCFVLTLRADYEYQSTFHPRMYVVADSRVILVNGWLARRGAARVVWVGGLF